MNANRDRKVEMNIIRTDHKEHSLVLFPRIKCLIREGLNALLNDPKVSVILRDDAMDLLDFVEDPENMDFSGIVSKTKSFIQCPTCKGTRIERINPECFDVEVAFNPCTTCKGEGQLYEEILRRAIVPTDNIRKLMTE